jgi:hypothetical protein
VRGQPPGFNADPTFSPANSRVSPVDRLRLLTAPSNAAPQASTIPTWRAAKQNGTEMSVGNCPYPPHSIHSCVPGVLSSGWKEYGTVMQAQPTGLRPIPAFSGIGRWPSHVAGARIQLPRSRNQEAKIPEQYDPRRTAGRPGSSQQVLGERDRGRDLYSSLQTLNQYSDRWLEACAKPRLRAKSFHTLRRLLRRYQRTSLCSENAGAWKWSFRRSNTSASSAA